MKKLLSFITAAIMATSSTLTVISCGSGEDTVIKYSYVNNMTDKNETAMMEKIEKQFYDLYGKKYTLKGMKYEDENKLPEEMLKIGNDSAPDVISASTDMVSKLATQGLVLALEGADSVEGADEILKKSKYDVAHAQEVMARFNNPATSASVTAEEKWGTWLPYAIESSKIKSNNEKAKEKNPVQYGITKHLGVGGGSALISTDAKSKEVFIKKLGLAESFNEKDGSFVWKKEPNSVKEKTISINEFTQASAEMTNNRGEKQFAANGYFPFLLDRGMWWMYPVYANIISKPATDGKIYKASEIGMNWINNKELPYYEKNDGKYSSVWSNSYFKDSAKEILGKWFDLFSQQIKVAANVLDGTKAEERAINLTDPSANAQVQQNLIKHALSGGVNYEPGSYIDMLKGFNRFANMDWFELQKLTMFDSSSENALKKKYDDQGLNRWLTPAGSGMLVFNQKLAKNKEKFRMAQKFVQLQMGVIEDKNGDVTFAKDGGIRNLYDAFVVSGDNPAKLAIRDKTITDSDEFNQKLEARVQVKFGRADEMVPGYTDSLKPGEREKELAAVRRLEKWSVTWAANIYSEAAPAISFAPNRSSYDTATDNDHHGNQAMKPSLIKALFKTEGNAQVFNTDVYGSFATGDLEYRKDEKYTSAKNTFVEDMIKSLSELNKNQSANN
ncbi:hypothetical protein [Williamsoniiplasma luminosum]|uniref:Lipoprotein n=1 Tax=Williamsoniiplasma luminosum TaxID=214888 RepID=A0A2S0NIZ5_9MOLU|nr:hypothetical protein [Williamsoniiplasma luminosum]AVP48986.1 MAG: hypothetical protein C5T88_00055 [Williamsoniiplasma luminosum]